MNCEKDPEFKKTRLVWKSDTHHLIMDKEAHSRSVDRPCRRRMPHTSSPIRPGSVPTQRDHAPTSSPIDNDRHAYKQSNGRSSRGSLHARFCDGIDTRGRKVCEESTRESVHECNMIRRRCASEEDLQRKLQDTQTEARLLEASRSELLTRLREAEFEARAHKRQATELQEVLRNIRRCESNNTSTSIEVANLNRQKDDLLHRIEVAEESNRHLRELLRTADIETGRLKSFEADRDNIHRRLEHLECENSKLVKQLAENDVLKAQLQRQVHAREADCERMTVQLRNVEKKYGRDSQEIMNNYDQLKRATRAWKSKWQKAEEELEVMKKQFALCEDESRERLCSVQIRLETVEKDRERLRCQLDELTLKIKEAESALIMSRSNERELSTEMACLDQKLRDSFCEVEALKRKNNELVCELEAAADREIQSRMGQEHASREFDSLRERMAHRCNELECLVSKLRCGSVSSKEAKDSVLSMKLERMRDELEATRARNSCVSYF